MIMIVKNLTGVYRMAGKVSKYWPCGTQIDSMRTMSPIGTAEHHKEWVKLGLAIQIYESILLPLAKYCGFAIPIFPSPFPDF